MDTSWGKTGQRGCETLGNVEFEVAMTTHKHWSDRPGPTMLLNRWVGFGAGWMVRKSWTNNTFNLRFLLMLCLGDGTCCCDGRR